MIFSRIKQIFQLGSLGEGSMLVFTGDQNGQRASLIPGTCQSMEASAINCNRYLRSLAAGFWGRNLQPGKVQPFFWDRFPFTNHVDPCAFWS